MGALQWDLYFAIYDLPHHFWCNQYLGCDTSLNVPCFSTLPLLPPGLCLHTFLIFFFTQVGFLLSSRDALYHLIIAVLTDFHILLNYKSLLNCTLWDRARMSMLMVRFLVPSTVPGTSFVCICWLHEQNYCVFTDCPSCFYWPMLFKSWYNLMHDKENQIPWKSFYFEVQ